MLFTAPAPATNQTNDRQQGDFDALAWLNDRPLCDTAATENRHKV